MRVTFFMTLQNFLSPFFSRQLCLPKTSKTQLRIHQIHTSFRSTQTSTCPKEFEWFKLPNVEQMNDSIFQIQKVIAIIIQGTMFVSSYYIKIKSLWNELDTYRSSSPCNKMKAHNDENGEDHLMHFLMGLNNTYI